MHVDALGQRVVHMCLGQLCLAHPTLEVAAHYRHQAFCNTCFDQSDVESLRTQPDQIMAKLLAGAQAHVDAGILHSAAMTDFINVAAPKYLMLIDNLPPPGAMAAPLRQHAIGGILLALSKALDTAFAQGRTLRACDGVIDFLQYKSAVEAAGLQSAPMLDDAAQLPYGIDREGTDTGNGGVLGASSLFAAAPAVASAAQQGFLAQRANNFAIHASRSVQPDAAATRDLPGQADPLLQEGQKTCSNRLPAAAASGGSDGRARCDSGHSAGSQAAGATSSPARHQDTAPAAELPPPLTPTNGEAAPCSQGSARRRRGLAASALAARQRVSQHLAELASEEETQAQLDLERSRRERDRCHLSMTPLASRDFPRRSRSRDRSAGELPPRLPSSERSPAQADREAAVADTAAADACNASSGATQKMQIGVRTSCNELVEFRVKPSASVAKVLALYCERHSLDRSLYRCAILRSCVLWLLDCADALLWYM